MDKAGSVLGQRGGLGGAQSLLPQLMAPGEPGVGGFVARLLGPSDVVEKFQAEHTR